MANSDVEVFNEMSGNGTVNLLIVSYTDETDDPNYYPHPRRIQVHNNIYTLVDLIQMLKQVIWQKHYLK